MRFVVMGDNQPEGTETLGQPDVFRQIVREVNQLQPAFVTFQTWERGSATQEHYLRRLGPAMAPLPLQSLTPLPSGTVRPAGEGGRQGSSLDGVQAFTCGDAILVVNDSAEEKEITLALPRAVPAGLDLVEVGDGWGLIDRDARQRQTVRLPLQPFGIRVLKAVPGGR